MKLFAIFAVLLLAGLVGAELDTEEEVAKTVKDTVFFEDYFEITLTKKNLTEGYEGWSNYTAHITCKNGTSEGDMLFPYEEVQYILAVRSLGSVLEKIGEGNLVYVPGKCDLTVSGKSFVSKNTKNITLVHLFKPQHSRVPAKEYEVHQFIHPTNVGVQNFLVTKLKTFLDRTTAIVALGLGITLILLGILLYSVMLNKSYSYIALGLGILLSIMGVFMGVM